MKKIELVLVVIAIGIFGECDSRSDEQNQHNEPVKIGGVFDSGTDAENIFKFAVSNINSMRDRNYARLQKYSKEIQYGNEFQASQAVCKMIETDGVIGIIGPTSPESMIHVRSLCDSKEIPLIETAIDGSSKHVINLHPTPDDLGRVYLDMIEAWGWEGFTVLYQDAPWLPFAEYILKNYNSDFTVTIRQLDITANANYRPQLRRVKQSQDKNIVLISSIGALPEILKQAQQVGLMTDEHQIIISSLDMHTIDLEPFQYSGTNITGFRMVLPPEDSFVKHVTESFEEWFMKKTHKREEPREDEKGDEDSNDQSGVEIPEGLTAEKLLLETALTYDAVLLFSHVMSQHSNLKPSRVNCNDRDSLFVNGTSIFNSLKTTTIKGLSGDIQFNQHGNRENFEVDVLELGSDGLKKIGTWNSTKGIQTLKGKTIESSQTDPGSLRNKTLIVLTVINAPYGMIKETLIPLKGNDMYEGFGIEMIQKLSEKLGFNYEFKLQEDKSYGSLSKETGEWDGMLRKLIDGEADLAITDLTITAERESGVDFTMPFMNLGISILFEKPKKEDPELFSFMQPFSSGVWVCLSACFFLVSISLFIMGRLSPAEWDNPFPCIEEPEVLINQFSFKNSMWFSIGALLQQGSEIAPKAPSTRIVASLWWFFTLIIVSSYTANLAAFLTIENPYPLIESVDDLIDNKVDYGAKDSGSTLNFFRDSSNENYRKMYDHMMKNKKLLLQKTNEEGLERAKLGKYAFLMESSTIEYMTQRNCDVSQVGGKLDEKGYGIAMRKNSPYRGALSEAVLQMQESGEISRMKTKWWKEKRGGGACGDGDGGEGGVEKLNMKNLGGVFLVLTVGCCFAIFLGIFRWFYNIRKMSRSLQIPFKDVFIEEVRFFRQFGNNVKTVQTRKSLSQLDSANGSNGSRSRSSGALNDNTGFRMSLKNVNKVPRGNDFDQI